MKENIGLNPEWKNVKVYEFIFISYKGAMENVTYIHSIISLSPISFGYCKFASSQVVPYFPSCCKYFKCVSKNKTCSSVLRDASSRLFHFTYLFKLGSNFCIQKRLNNQMNGAD